MIDIGLANYECNSYHQLKWYEHITMNRQLCTHTYVVEITKEFFNKT